jgi:hypothetical protein
MSNANRICGLKPIGHLIIPTLKAQMHEYTLTASATVYEGDILKVVAGGTVEAAAEDDGIIVIGVAAQYKVAPATGITKVLVYDDPYTIFELQADDGANLAATAVFAAGDHDAGAGNATTKQSGHQLDADTVTNGTLQLKVLGLVDSPDNAWGLHAKVRVIFNEHFYKAAVTGL